MDLCDRFVGSVLQLCGRPLTRIAAMRTTTIRALADCAFALKLGRGEIPLPSRLTRSRCAIRNSGEPVSRGGCCPSRTPVHITADRLRERLKQCGIDRSDRRVEGRHAALLARAVRLPAPIIAERIGIHPARAPPSTRLAGATYADYVSLRDTGRGHAQSIGGD